MAVPQLKDAFNAEKTEIQRLVNALPGAEAQDDA